MSHRYPNKSPQQVITNLLGSDIQIDEDAVGEGVIGKAGGQMLAAYLHSIKDTHARMFKNDIMEWLEEQRSKYQVAFPVQEACIVHALNFLPELDSQLTKAAAAEVPPPVFHDEEEQ